MSKTVLHIDDVVHARLKAFCQKRGAKMSKWAAEILVAAMDEAEAPPVAVAPPAGTLVVEKNLQPHAPETPPVVFRGAPSAAPLPPDHPATLPPFWAGRGP